MAEFTRIYPFETVFNFRDFGGYATEDGREVVGGKLFRAAHLNRVSDAELARIGGLDIDLVVDLRYAPERERQPNRFWETGPAHHFEFTPVDGSPVHKIAPHEAFINEDLHSPDDARGYMMRSYSARPNDPGFRAVFGNTLLHMAEHGHGILIHCAAGKDRTGTLAALILFALGVDRDTILEDFMLTMEAVDIDAMLEPAAQMISERAGRAISPESIRPMFGVEAGYLEAALDTMGEPEAYLADALNVKAETRERLRRHYTNAGG